MRIFTGHPQLQVPIIGAVGSRRRAASWRTLYELTKRCVTAATGLRKILGHAATVIKRLAQTKFLGRASLLRRLSELFNRFRLVFWE